MPEEPFMLVSLREGQAKRLANVMSNATCTKLLNFLAQQGEGTESEIAKALKIPLSTVHYNLKQLVEAKLVTANEYHYSPKGREVVHYKLANKYIIIAPEEKEGLLESLKRILPVGLLVAGVSVILALIGLYTGTLFGRTSSVASAPSVISTESTRRMNEAVAEAPGAYGAMIADAAPLAKGAGSVANQTVEVVEREVLSQIVVEQLRSTGTWTIIVAFLCGAALALLFVALWRRRR